MSENWIINFFPANFTSKGMGVLHRIRSTFTNNPWSERINSALTDHVLSKGADNIARQVEEFGFVLIPNALADDIVRQLRSEFDEFIRTCDNSGYQVDKHDGAICVRVKPGASIDSSSYPATAAFFKSPICKQIGEAFYQTDGCNLQFNSEIFVHETPETEQPLSGALHWDRAKTLKFWIYIDDIPCEAGPMQIARGSGRSNAKERLARKGTLTKQQGGVDNLATTTVNDLVLLTGAAGTVLIQDTDASHGATHVEKGFSRRIMRGHTRMKPN